MYLGGSLALIAIGAILAFAVQDAISGVDLVMVGYICMAVGALGLVLGLVMGWPAPRPGGRARRPPAALTRPVSPRAGPRAGSGRG
ncbi:MAG: DUF6458 family protein [Aeromicrobium erythreum]